MNTKIGKKVLLTFGTFILILPFFLGLVGMKVAEADYADSPPTVTIEAHKVIYNDSDTYQNTGVVMSDSSTFPQGLEPVVGAGFTLYDISTYYYGLRNGTMDIAADGSVVAAGSGTFASSLLIDGKIPVGSRPLADNDSPKGAYQILVNWLKFAAPKYFTDTMRWSAVGSQITTDSDGIATFTDVPAFSSGKDAVYVMVETDVSAAKPTINRSVNTVLALPIYQMVPDENDVDNDGNTTELIRSETLLGDSETPITIYPKNKTPDMWKTLTGIQHNVSGQSVSIPTVGGLDPHTSKTTSDEADKAIYPVAIGDILTYKISFYVPSIGSGVDETIEGVVDPGGLNIYDVLPFGLRFNSLTSIVADAIPAVLGENDTEVTPEVSAVPITTTGTLSATAAATVTYAYTELGVTVPPTSPPTLTTPPSTLTLSGADVAFNIPYALLAAIPGRKVTMEFTVLVDGGAGTALGIYGDKYGFGVASPEVCDLLLGNEFWFNNGTTWLSEEDEDTPDKDTALVQMGDMPFNKIDGDTQDVLEGAVFSLYVGGKTAVSALSPVAPANAPIKMIVELAGSDTSPMIIRPFIEGIDTDGGGNANLVAPGGAGIKTPGQTGVEFAVPKGGVWIYGLESTVMETDTDSAGIPNLIANYVSGFYVLKEVKAPIDYVLPSDPFVETFDVSSVDFDGGEMAVDIVDIAFSVPNYHKGTLPSTGGQGIYLLLLIGLVGMILVAILWKRNKDREDKGFDVE